MNNKKGATLIELIIYITIVTGILIMASTFAWNIINNKSKSQAVQEVQENGRFIMEKLTQEIRAAYNITSVTNTPPKLTLSMKDTNLNPTITEVFYLQNNSLMFSQSNQTYCTPAVPCVLNSNQVKITNLNFTNLSSGNKTQNIKINLTIEHINPNQRPEWQASVNLESTVELRDR